MKMEGEPQDAAQKPQQFYAYAINYNQFCTAMLLGYYY
jgi:hypothetical protein